MPTAMRKVRLLSANVGLAALVAIDIPLIAAAVHHGHGPAVEQPAATAVTVADSSTSTSPSPPTPADSGRVVPTVTRHQPTLLVSFSGADSGWRARAGCKRAPHLASTTDGGHTWQPLHAPAAHVLRVTETGAGAGWLVGADASCTPAFYSTVDGGQTWAAGTGLGQAWAVIGRRLRVPDGAVARPCGKGRAEVVAAATVGTAVLQCSTGLVTTTDGGTSWKPVAAFPDGGEPVAAALVPGSDGTGVALLTGADGCGGLAVVLTTDAGKGWTSGPCLSGLAGPAAVSLAPDGSGYALAGKKSVRTADSGKTWTSAA